MIPSALGKLDGSDTGGANLSRPGREFMLSTYAQYQFYAKDLVKSAQRVAAEPVVKRDSAYYQANIGKVKTVDDFIGNFRLFSYAMKSYGLEDSIQNRGFMKKVLTSDLTDPKSFVNTLNDGRYKTFALQFSFGTNGKVVDTATAEDTDQLGTTLGLYDSRTLVGKTQSVDRAYFQAHIGQVTSVDALIADPRLYRVALQAYGIDPDTTSTATIRRVLESDPSDPNSFAATSGHSGDAAQSAADTKATVILYGDATGSDAESQARATIETAYYRSAVPAVTTVDNFLSDDRLVAYATTAFGLDYTSTAVLKYAQGKGIDTSKGLSASQKSDILRAALTSDVSNPSSVANTLGGGFKAVAQVFDFGATAIQSPSGTATVTSLYGQGVASDADSQKAAAAETSYYAATIPAVKTADQFVANPRLVAYAVQAFGLTFPSDATAAQKIATLKAALTGDPTDPQGAAATAGNSFVSFASAFNSAKPVYAQAGDSAESTVDLYGQAAGQDTDAATETAYYLSTMPDVKTADALLADPRLSAYVTAAYKITFPAGATDADKQAQLKAILTADPAVAGSIYGDGARRLAGAFQFDAKGAAVQGRNTVTATGLAAQPADALQATTDLYTERLGTDPLVQVAGRSETAYYKTQMAKVATIDDLVADKRLVAYAAAAYGVAFATGATDADKASELRAILTSDVNDPKSAAGQLGDSARQLAAAFTFNATYQGDAAIGRNGQDAYVKLAAAFNFDGQGAVTDPKLAQSARDTSLTLSAYVKHAGTAGSVAAKADAAYYTAAIGQVRTLGGFLSDPRLVKVATAAFGVTRDPKLSDAQWTAQLKSVLTSDIADPKSVASKLGLPFRKLAASFSFATDGTVARAPAQVAQSKKSAVLTADPYVQQVMEDEAGTQNKAVQLALNFFQKAPGITSAYQILADKSLLSVVETAFNLPASLSSLDIDTQARIINDAVKLPDLQDPKKLDKILRDYAIRTDVNAANAASPNPLLTLFDGGSSASASSVLGILNPAQSVDTTGMPILQLFQQS